jgi:uncharacterized membrane protein (DUF485 family)
VNIVYAGKDKISAVTIVAIVVPISVFVVLFVMGYCLLTRRARKKYNSVQKENGKQFCAL